MLFGLTNTPAVFQALVNDVLWDSFTAWCLFIWTTFSPSHGPKMNASPMYAKSCCGSWRTAFMRKRKKFEFHVSSIRFLGYIIGRWQIEANVEKIQVKADCQLQSCLSTVKITKSSLALLASIRGSSGTAAVWQYR